MAAPCTMELFRHDGEKAQGMSIEQSEMAPTRRIEQDEEEVTVTHGDFFTIFFLAATNIFISCFV